MAITRNTLDKRIKDLSDIQSFTRYNDKYIGETGYFSDSLCRFQDLKRCYKHTLININDDKEAGDLIFETKGGNYRYFLPESLLKPEKKYRAYTLAEWIDQHEIGEVIHCRNEHKQEFHVMYTGYVIEKGEDIQDIRTTGRIMLINMGYLLQELFERYEIEVNGEWVPFGIEE